MADRGFGTSSPDTRKRLTNDPGAQYASPVSPRPDPLPSDEAKAAAYNSLIRVRCREATVDKRESDKALTAAYRIDMPRREAEVRAATLREVSAWLEEADPYVARDFAVYLNTEAE